MDSEFILHIRTPLWNEFFLFINLFDTVYFPVILIPFLWFGCSPKWAFRVLVLLTLSTLINAGLKGFFELPRPCVADPSFCLIPIQSYSFPSGGAQTAALLGGLLFFSARSRAWKVGAILYFLIVSFSRIYLGVHYPRDVLGGWVIGAFLLWAYFLAGPRVERWLEHLPPHP